MDAADAAGGGGSGVEEGISARSSQPRLAAPALACGSSGGSGGRGTPDVCREVFERLVADGHAEALPASRAARGPFRHFSTDVCCSMNQNFRKFYWEDLFLSYWGSVPISYLPEESPRTDADELILCNSFQDKCIYVYAVTTHILKIQRNYFGISRAHSFRVQVFLKNQSTSWMIEEITGKTKRTRTEQRESHPAGKMLDIGDEEEEKETVLTDAREEAPLPAALPSRGNQAVLRPPGVKYCPRRTRVQIQDLSRRITLGSRSKFDAKEWICTKCTWTNKPQKHLLAYLPPFFCENCNFNLLEMDDYEFFFSMADLTVNSFPPISNIKDQGNSKHCTVYGASNCLEITDRMSTILAGEEPEGISNEGPVLDTTDFLTKTLNMMKRCNINQGKHHTKFNYKTALVAFEVATTEGVKVVAAGPAKKVKQRTVKASGKQFVPCNFATITQRLADGIPQTAYILIGKKFENLKHGQIYKSPKRPEGNNHGKKIQWHSVVLVGAGKRRKGYFYDFENTFGVKFAMRVPVSPTPGPDFTWIGGIHNGKSERIPGGIGKVRATDAMILQPMEFVRYPRSDLQAEPWVSLNYCASHRAIP